VAGPDDWVSASDLADYAFCPRSHYYHEHPPAGEPDQASQARADAGRRYHTRTLGAERRRAEAGGAYWGALLAGSLVVVGGLAWIFLR
jgi:CRISPR/Cas system-associated exonuclease Cas4 (RecB family)